MSLLNFLVIVGLVIFGGTSLYLAARIIETHETLFRLRKRLKQLEGNGHSS